MAKVRKDREPIGKAITLKKGQKLDDHSAMSLDILDAKGRFWEPEGPVDAWSLVDPDLEEEEE